VAAGHSWDDLQRLAVQQADHIFVSKNLAALKARDVDLYFHPGTHDFVAFDIAWGGKHYPQIPLYLRANSGHGSKPHENSEKDEANKAAFLLQHFFSGTEKMLEPPSVSYDIAKGKLNVTVKFEPESGDDSGTHLVDV